MAWISPGVPCSVKVDATARALQVLGIKQGDQIPVFLRSVPEFIYLLLAAERIGASLLCRDNTPGRKH